MIRDPPRSTLFPYTTLSQSFEVVPGVTAGIAAPAYAGIPVTHRGLAGGVAFVTGFTQETELDLADLARFPGTLVFYMGVKIGRAPRLNSSHANISYAVFCLK